MSAVVAERVEPAVEPSTRRSLAYVYVGYAFRYLYLLVLIPFYGRVLGADAYGQLTVVMSLFQVVWMVVEWGLPTAGMRDVAQASSSKAIAQIYGQQMSARLWLCVPALALGAGAVALSPVLRSNPALAGFALATGLVAAFNMGWFFVGTLRFQTSVWLEVLGFAINLPLIVGLVQGPADAHWVMAILLGSGLLTTLIAHGVAWRTIRPHAVSLQGGPSLIAATFSLFVYRGMSLAMASSTSLLMSMFSSPAAVGLYSAADRLISAALSLLQPANQVLMGKVSHRLGADDARSGYALMRLSLLLITGAGLLLTLATWLLAPHLVVLIFGGGFSASAEMLRVLSLLFPMAALVQVITGHVLIPHRLDATASWITLLGATVSVGLIFMLGMSYGGTGVSWARVLGHGLMVAAALWAMKRHGLMQRVFHPH